MEMGGGVMEKHWDAEGAYPCHECDAVFIFAVCQGENFSHWQYADDDVVCDEHHLVDA
jgi:hypothetical protein